MKIIGQLQSVEIPMLDLEYEVRKTSTNKLSIYLTKESYRRLLGSIMILGLSLEDLGPVENINNNNNNPPQEIEIS
jgi:hypothetical protein